MKKIVLAALALIVVMASCVKDPQYPGITISNVSRNPVDVQEGMSVTVSATITSFNEVTPILYYTVNDAAAVDVKMVASQEEKNLYTAVIPGQAEGAKVNFYIEVVSDLTAKSPVMEYVVGAVIIDYSVLRLNELNGNDKFIEIYNSGAEAIPMKGVAIQKDEDQNWVGSEAVTVEPGAYLLLYSEDVVIDHPELDTANYVFHSGLSAKKNVRIQMFTPAGESIDDFNLVDIAQNGAAYGYENNQAPASYSRNADGVWYYADATPGAANINGENIVLGLEGSPEPPTPPTPEEPDYADLVLNELSPEYKYIEFYNKGNFDLSLEGMYIMKNDDTEPIWTGDNTLVVPANGYLVIYSDKVEADHPDLAGTAYIFSGGISGKKALRIALFMPDGTQRDEFTRRNSEEMAWDSGMTDVSPKSYARTPDGGEWKLADATEGTANPAEGEDIPLE
ncbi:MAG: lamin tail domain-containing protein [Bacteroidales bacterium]|nr:lamin tail domain-containing protein [Bacteroidales bacterium]